MENIPLEKVIEIMKDNCQSRKCCETHGGRCICDSCRTFYNKLGWDILKK